MTIGATRKYGNRRKRIATLLITTPLLADGLPPEAVEVTVQGVKMSNPHGVRIALSNVGPLDIVPGDFPRDALGRIRIAGSTQMGPLQGDLRAKDGTLLSETGDVGGGGSADPTLWEFMAVHIPAGATVTFTGIVDGQPTGLKLDPLFDVDVAPFADPNRSPRGVKLLTFGGTLLCIVPGLLAIDAHYAGDTAARDFFSVLAVLGGVSFFCGILWEINASLRRTRMIRILFPEVLVVSRGRARLR